MSTHKTFEERYDRLIDMSERLVSMSEQLIQQRSQDQQERREMMRVIQDLEQRMPESPSARVQPSPLAASPSTATELPSGVDFLQERIRPKLSRLFLQAPPFYKNSSSL